MAYLGAQHVSSVPQLNPASMHSLSLISPTSSVSIHLNIYTSVPSLPCFSTTSLGRSLTKYILALETEILPFLNICDLHSAVSPPIHQPQLLERTRLHNFT